jgi:FAD/FMN-containing dehydrogenase
MSLRFPPRRLRAIVRQTIAELPENAPPERVLAAVHRALRAAFPGEIAADLRWSTVSACFGTQVAAPLSVCGTEYLALTGVAVPTGGETGRFLANMEDIVLCGEIEQQDTHRQERHVYRPGDSVIQPAGAGGLFAVRDQVWLLEHMTGFLPAMFLLPLQAALFGTGNLRSLVGMCRDSLRLWLGGDGEEYSGQEWKNWLGNVVAHPRSVRRVNNEWEVVEIVHEVQDHNAAQPKEPWGIRCFGTRHSWSALAPADGIMLDMTAMDSVLSIDVERQQITVQPGLELGTLLTLAWEEGWRVRSVTALKKITVGGMLAVGAHGNDTSASTFSDDVVAIRFVDGTGQIQEVDQSDLEALRAARINLGALGVVVSFTIQCYPSGLFLYQSQKLRHADVATQAQIDALVADNQLVEIYWFPFIDKVQVLTWNEVPADDPPPFVPVYGWKQRTWNWLIQNVGQYLVGSPVAFFVDRIMPSAGWVLAWLSSLLFSSEETLQEPIDAGHYLYAYHKVWDSGWAVPADKTADALRVYSALIDSYEADGHYPVNICVHMRFIRAGGSLLGFGGAKDGSKPEALLCQIEAATTAHADQIKSYFEDTERIFLQPYFAGRPHWAKEWYVGLHAFTLGGTDAWTTFREWRERFDPEGIYANDLIREVDASAARVGDALDEHGDHGAVREALVELSDRGQAVLRALGLRD